MSMIRVEIEGANTVPTCAMQTSESLKGIIGIATLHQNTIVFVMYFNEFFTQKGQVYAIIFIVKHNKLHSAKISQNKSTRAFILLVEEEEETGIDCESPVGRNYFQVIGRECLIHYFIGKGLRLSMAYLSFILLTIQL